MTFIQSQLELLLNSKYNLYLQKKDNIHEYNLINYTRNSVFVIFSFKILEIDLRSQSFIICTIKNMS